VVAGRGHQSIVEVIDTSIHRSGVILVVGKGVTVAAAVAVMDQLRQVMVLIRGTSTMALIALIQN